MSEVVVKSGDLYGRTNKFVIEEFNKVFGNTPEDRRKIYGDRMDTIAARWKEEGFTGLNDK